MCDIVYLLYGILSAVVIARYGADADYFLEKPLPATAVSLVAFMSLAPK